MKRLMKKSNDDKIIYEALMNFFDDKDVVDEIIDNINSGTDNIEIFPSDNEEFAKQFISKNKTKSELFDFDNLEQYGEYLKTRYEDEYEYNIEIDNKIIYYGN